MVLIPAVYCYGFHVGKHTTDAWILWVLYAISIQAFSQGTMGCTPNVRVLPWYFLCSTLGFLGIKTHQYPRDIGLINRDFPFSGSPRWARATSWPNSPDSQAAMGGLASQPLQKAPKFASTAGHGTWDL